MLKDRKRGALEMGRTILTNEGEQYRGLEREGCGYRRNCGPVDNIVWTHWR